MNERNVVSMASLARFGALNSHVKVTNSARNNIECSAKIQTFVIIFINSYLINYDGVINTQFHLNFALTSQLDLAFPIKNTPITPQRRPLIFLYRNKRHKLRRLVIKPTLISVCYLIQSSTAKWLWTWYSALHKWHVNNQ